MLSDTSIAQNAVLKPIGQVAADLGVPEQYVIPYGKTKAKIDLKFLNELKEIPDGKLVLVTATTPTPAGEGKTTTTIGLAQALVKMGRKAVVCLREPSLGPCFGVKGGAAGGGYSQVLPMDEINLHFTGDIHAVSAAHNLLSALVDNHLQQGNRLDIDPRRVVFRRVMDMNDRSLRQIVIGLGGKGNGVPRENGFDISVSSEVMAILCLAGNLKDLKERLAKIVVGYTYSGQAVTARDLKAEGAMTALLKDALNPNLVQTIEHVPAFVHGGPFANIAHGTNSLSATKMALKLGDVAVVEAGFASDLGGEKFFDIACRYGEFSPRCVVLVTSVRALKMHGGLNKENLKEENIPALTRGFENLDAHIENLAQFGVPVVVALNRFPTDTENEMGEVIRHVRAKDAEVALSEVWEKGGNGGLELAEKVLKALEKPAGYRPLYELDLPLTEKIALIADRVYGAAGVDFTDPVRTALADLEAGGYGKLPVCMAKTQMSLSDDPKKIGRPKGWRLTVREVRLSAGAGFVVPICGTIMTMPGLPRVPSAESVDVDDQGRVIRLF
ncbi:MAG: Formate--tetrahydrofolate ligase [Synergistetes bacterium ADurb.Bin155]|mgnify:FL=1|jgi:formate--tetrahydrofolate ligase|nr:formate--tetrahydrofolate ligase [Synergistales bacterium]MBP8996013.1 formate--tetrahydrofolate ligase [Synergistales bacterium]NMD16977.1 formate--tetrahydrofolate ligase [Synergistaceae bacterium]OQB46614.1 MAG: Formate--tetrahydrofolate ligase [Synergistetes bacterium ADurb.Bin155]HQL02621.1 formate--tetrahydrofolate ligase [Synergistales bacterium]